MVKKPARGLPDVFAKPDGAPARGVPNADQSTEDPTTGADPDVHAVASVAPTAEPTVSTVDTVAPAGEPTDAAEATALAEAPIGQAADTETPAVEPIVGTAEATAPAGEPVASVAAIATPEAIGSTTEVPAQTDGPADHAIHEEASAAEPIASIASGAKLAGEPISGAADDATPAVTSPPMPEEIAPTHAAVVAAAEVSRGRMSLGGVPAVVWGILIISLTAPAWEGWVLSGLGIHTPPERVATQNAADLARQNAKIAALEQQLTSTTTQLGVMRADLALATQRATQAVAEARAMALLRLADALRGAAPFGTELAALRATGGDTGDLQAVLVRLTPYVTTGAPTQDQLLRDLRALHDGVARAVRQANPGSWMDLINWTGLNGPQPPAPVDPDLRAARLGMNRLVVGDITGAIDLASQASGSFQADFADWITEAKARLAADAALRDIDALIAHPTGTP